MKIFAIRDKRTNAYREGLVLKPHMAEAVRMFEQIANNPESDLNKWPLDFQLDQIGEFDMRQGTIVNDQKEVCQISDLIKKTDRPIIDPVETRRPEMNQ
jgi:hypothetical protein